MIAELNLMMQDHVKHIHDHKTRCGTHLGSCDPPNFFVLFFFFINNILDEMHLTHDVLGCQHNKYQPSKLTQVSLISTGQFLIISVIKLST